jgi:predicted acylesterase/phospholipase RssA
MTTATEYTKDLSVVYDKECEYLEQRRRSVNLKKPIGNSSQGPCIAHGNVGLALSGGGIRSATFSLGVVQALAKLDLLKHVDYLSTVSGGGYLGSCITSLLTADPTAGVSPSNFPLRVAEGGREQEEIRHLRQYSNYLSPQHGPFKLETWRLIAWYIAALVFNLLAPLAATATILAVGTWMVMQLWNLSAPLGIFGVQSGLVLLIFAALVPFLLGSILLFCTKKKVRRDWCVTASAYAAAITLLPAFLFVAPAGYNRLIDWTIKVQPVSIDTLKKSFVFVGLCPDPLCIQTQGYVSQVDRALRLSGVWMWRSSTLLQRLAEKLDPQCSLPPEMCSAPATFAATVQELREAGFSVGYSESTIWSYVQALFPLLAAFIPAAFIGYLKGSLRVFGIAFVGLVAAVLLNHWLGRLYGDGSGWLCLCGWLSIAAIVLGFLVNINRVSLINLYRDRLADCYIIQRQKGNAISCNDDLQLGSILPKANGPYPLVNCVLNLSGSRDLELKGRMAADFLFSKYYCGSSREKVGYRATDKYAQGKFDLATAMAISGAAVSPQSGSATQPGLAVLMTLFNLRLGQWLPNPNPEEEKPRYAPVFWNSYLAKELFSLADENDWFVSVSDGGFFENMGVYSLLQRRCKLIIAVDNGADPERKFEDLAGLIRKARIDFGIEIALDFRPLHGDLNTKKAERGYAIGTIVYPPSQRNGPIEKGRFIYIKPTLSQDQSESEDLLEYARNHPSFPQETTADQFFDEAQFESYRKLGCHIAETVLERCRALIEA